jgi:cation diffusion facilitator CzcD-associated flavoprotein CzcO
MPSPQISPNADLNGDGEIDVFDAIVIGAGVSGLYQTYCLRQAGLSVRCFEEAGGVAGCWYWNRYPGCALDSPSESYGYSFSDELLQEWDWKHHYSKQPDTEEYLNFVADKFNLRPYIQLSTRVLSAVWHEEQCVWEVEVEGGQRARASFLVPAVGHLSAPLTPSFEGTERFQGQVFHASRWPREDPDFGGKRVAVIGTSATGMQISPELAKVCAHLTVFQRTAVYGIPADNAPIDPEVQREWKSRYQEIHKLIRENATGTPVGPDPRSGHEFTQEERLAHYEQAWKRQGYEKFLSIFWDVHTDLELNAEYAEFLRGKIRAQVNDPVLAEKLVPAATLPFGARRIPLETGYYDAFNRDNVSLVDVRETPIECLTEQGIRTSEREHEFDIIIYATGYDGVTGALSRIDIRGADGQSLKAKWDAQGLSTYLGLTSAGFPNLLISNNGALCNYTICAEWIAEWITEFVQYMRRHRFDRMEPTPEAEAAWVEHHDEMGAKTFWGHAEYSWYLGSNVPGKKRRFTLYAQTGPAWRKECYGAIERGYEGFTLRRQSDDGPVDTGSAATVPYAP